MFRCVHQHQHQHIFIAIIPQPRDSRHACNWLSVPCYATNGANMLCCLWREHAFCSWNTLQNCLESIRSIDADGWIDGTWDAGRCEADIGIQKNQRQPLSYRIELGTTSSLAHIGLSSLCSKVHSNQTATHQAFVWPTIQCLPEKKIKNNQKVFPSAII